MHKKKKCKRCQQTRLILTFVMLVVMLAIVFLGSESGMSTLSP